MASRVIRHLRYLTDVVFGSPADGDVVTYDEGTDSFVLAAPTGGGGGSAASTTFSPAGSIAATDVQAALEELDAEKAAVSHAHAGEDITSGTVADARIASTIARDTEVTAAVAAEASARDAAIASAVSTHEADTTNVHGIADTSALALSSDLLLPDGVTLEQSVGVVQVKDGGITVAKLAFDPATQAELDAHTGDTSGAHAASAISIVDSGAYFSGADVEAALQELGAAGGAGGGISSGTSFPGSPSSGDLFFRTDNGLLFYYDGTRWLTVSSYRQALNLSNTAITSSTTYAYCPLSAGLDMWAVSMDVVSYVGSPTDATNYWTIELQKVTAGNTWSSVASRDTKTDTATQWTASLVSIGALVQVSAHKGLRILATKTAAPGGLFCGVALNYRLVGA